MPEAWGTVIIKSSSNIDSALAEGIDFDDVIQQLTSFAGLDSEKVKALDFNYEESRLEGAYLEFSINNSDWLIFSDYIYRDSNNVEFYSNLRDEYGVHQLCSVNAKGIRLIYAVEEDSDEFDQVGFDEENFYQSLKINNNKWGRSIPGQVKKIFPEILKGVELGKGLSGRSVFRKLQEALEEKESVDEHIPKIFQLEDIQLAGDDTDDLIYYLYEAITASVCSEDLLKIFKACIESGYDVNGIRGYEPVIVSLVYTAFNDLVYDNEPPEEAQKIFENRLKIIELFLINGANPNYVADGHQFYKSKVLVADQVDLTIDENTSQEYLNILLAIELDKTPDELLDLLLPYCDKSIINYALTVDQLKKGIISIGEELSYKDIDEKFQKYFAE